MIVKPAVGAATAAGPGAFAASVRAGFAAGFAATGFAVGAFAVGFAAGFDGVATGLLDRAAARFVGGRFAAALRFVVDDPAGPVEPVDVSWAIAFSSPCPLGPIVPQHRHDGAVLPVNASLTRDEMGVDRVHRRLPHHKRHPRPAQWFFAKEEACT